MLFVIQMKSFIMQKIDVSDTEASLGVFRLNKNIPDVIHSHLADLVFKQSSLRDINDPPSVHC